MMAEAHRTAAGYQMTARFRDSEGVLVVFTADGPTEEIARERLSGAIEGYFDRIANAAREAQV